MSVAQLVHVVGRGPARHAGVAQARHGGAAGAGPPGRRAAAARARAPLGRRARRRARALRPLPGPALGAAQGTCTQDCDTQRETRITILQATSINI